MNHDEFMSLYYDEISIFAEKALREANIDIDDPLTSTDFKEWCLINGYTRPTFKGFLIRNGWMQRKGDYDYATNESMADIYYS